MLTLDYSHMSHYSLRASYITFRCPRVSYNKVCIWSFSPGDGTEGGMEQDMQGSGWHCICRASIQSWAEL